MNTIISVENLSISFHHEKIIENLSFEINEGEKVVITGISGKGKSTLLNVLIGFIPNFDGKINILNKILNQQNISLIRKQISWLPQETALDFEFVKDLFFTPFDFNSNKDKKPTRYEIEKIFSKFDLSIELLDKKTQEISGGQKQRIMLASAIFLKKKILFLDEPVSALDDNLKHKITDFMMSLDITIIASSHDEYWIRKSDKKINL